MWIFAKDAFLSIVAHDAEDGLLRVRARFEGDIERLFPEADVAENVDEDYRFVTSVPRQRVAEVLALQIQHLEYTSFKDAVAEPDRHRCYLGAWHVLSEEQKRQTRNGG
jgi:hypothetical protein